MGRAEELQLETRDSHPSVTASPLCELMNGDNRN